MNYNLSDFELRLIGVRWDTAAALRFIRTATDSLDALKNKLLLYCIIFTYDI